jgi:hypothetical protein
VGSLDLRSNVVEAAAGSDQNGGEDELVRGDKDHRWVCGESHSSCRDGHQHGSR